MTDPGALVAAVGLYAGAFAVGALSSVVPFILIDAFVIAAALQVGARPGLVPIVILAACGQVAGKLPMFYGARGITALSARRSERARARIEWVRAWVTRWGRRPHLTLAVSALVGIPPFSLLATAAGVLAIRIRAFCAIVVGCRTARFAVIAAIAIVARR